MILDVPRPLRLQRIGRPEQDAVYSRAMLNETFAGILALPGWVQGFLAFFVACVLVMVFGPGFTHRRVARQFAALATASGATVTPGADKLSGSFAPTLAHVLRELSAVASAFERTAG